MAKLYEAMQADLERARELALLQAKEIARQVSKDRRDRFAMAALTGILISDYSFAVSKPERAAEIMKDLADAAMAKLGGLDWSYDDNS